LPTRESRQGRVAREFADLDRLARHHSTFGRTGHITSHRSCSECPSRRGKRSNEMPLTYLIFGDIAGKLDVMRVECTKC
jgi:hypothetical protein